MAINVFFENLWHVSALIMHKWVLNLQIRGNFAQFMPNFHYPGEEFCLGPLLYIYENECLRL